MCVSVILWQPNTPQPLLIAHNRDEFHARPTASAAVHGNVIHGTDLTAGGTWLVAAADGRFAMVLNYRQGIVTNGSKSRGSLPLAFITDRRSPAEHVAALAQDAQNYGAFILVCGSLREGIAAFRSVDGATVDLAAGLHTVSNGGVNGNWSKERRLADSMRGGIDPLQALHDATPAADADLPRTGVSLELERVLSPVFVQSPKYGTRASTVISMSADGRVRYIERSYDPNGVALSDVNLLLGGNRD